MFINKYEDYFRTNYPRRLSEWKVRRLGQVFRGYKLITDDSDSFYAFIRGDVEKIISYKPEFIKIINDELLSLLDDEWATHPTKGVCYVFKKQWFEDFKEFFTPQVPFFYYFIWSYIKGGELYINVGFYIDEHKDTGKLLNLRNKFIEILDLEIKKNEPKSHYNKKNMALKFKKEAIEGGYDNYKDLKNVAIEMKNLIDDTLLSIENSIESLKKNMKMTLKNGKKNYLTSNEN